MSPPFDASTRRTFLRTGLAGSLAVAAGCQTEESNGERDTTETTPGTASRTILGCYPGANPAARATFGPFERWLGRRHAVIVCYVDASREAGAIRRFVDGPMTRIWETSHVPMVTWEPHPTNPTERERGIVATIHDGGLDGVIDRWAARLDAWSRAERDSGRPRRCYFRPLPEMNRTGAAWGGADPAAFRGAWRHLHDRVSRAGLSGDRLRWLWNPNASDVGTPRAERYYPGDDYVDWVGVDGYNFGDTASWARWQSPKSVLGPMLERMGGLTDKPVAIPEFGSTSRRDGQYRPAAKAAWITDAFAYLREAGVGMACWFNVDKETDWAVFGGGRGTSRYRASDGKASHEYAAYDAYRHAARRKGVVDARSRSAGVLTDAAFAGDT